MSDKMRLDTKTIKNQSYTKQKTFENEYQENIE